MNIIYIANKTNYAWMKLAAQYAYNDFKWLLNENTFGCKYQLTMSPDNTPPSKEVSTAKLNATGKTDNFIIINKDIEVPSTESTPVQDGTSSIPTLLLDLHLDENFLSTRSYLFEILTALRSFIINSGIQKTYQIKYAAYFYSAGALKSSMNISDLSELSLKIQNAI